MGMVREGVFVSRSRIEETEQIAVRTEHRLEGLILSIIAFLLAIIGSIYLSFVLRMLNMDAYSRVLNAYYTIFSKSFHLAAMGFVWNPLPSLLEIPLVSLHHWFPALLTRGYAGNIISSLSSGVGIYFLDRILLELNIPRVWRITVCAIYLLNPMIWMFASNGMSESMMIATLLGSLNGAIAYLRREELSSLIAMGVWLAFCFAARYEAVPFALVVGLAFAIALRMKGHSPRRIEANAILVALPLIVSGIVWIALNWTIMGNPFYFFDSSYSNSAQIATGTYNVSTTLRDAHHWLYSLLSAMHYSFLFPPVVLGIGLTIILFFFRRSYRPEFLVLSGATFAIPLFQVVMLYQHSSAMWARFFIFYIPSGFLLMMAVARAAVQKRRLLSHIVLGLASLSLLIGDVMTLENVQKPFLGRGVVAYFQAVLTAQHKSNQQFSVLKSGQSIAHYINSHPNEVVLLDTFDAGNIIPFIKRRKQVVITNDVDFQSVLLNPRGRVSAFLVPSSSKQLGGLDAINRTYPGLWAGHVAWAHLITDFPGPYHFKLYRVGSQAP